MTITLIKLFFSWWLHLSLLRKVYLREVGSLSRVMNVGVDLLSVEKVFELLK